MASKEVELPSDLFCANRNLILNPGSPWCLLEEHGFVRRRRQPRLPATRIISSLLWGVLCLNVVTEGNKCDFVNMILDRDTTLNLTIKYENTRL